MSLPCPPPSRWRSRGRTLVFWVLALLPSLYYLVEWPGFGRLPYNDYYNVVYDLTTEDGWSRDLGTWLGVRSNEHRVALPALVYLANYWLTDGDNRGHSAVVILLIFGLLFLFHRWLPDDIRGSRVTALPITLLISLLLWNPVQSHNIVLGFSGVMWLLSNFLAVVAITTIVRAPDDSVRPAVAAGAAGLLGALSYSSNLMLWPSLVAGCLLLRRRRQAICVAVGGVLVYAYYFGTYVQPRSSPDFERDLGAVLRFAGAYLGSLFTDHTEPAIAIGLCAILATSLFFPVALRRAAGRRRQLAPWFMLTLYVMGNAFGTAIGRARSADVELGMAFSSRYANLAALFWVGFLIPVAILAADWVRQGSRRRLVAAALAPVLLVAIGAGLWHRGDPGYRKRLERARQQPLAAVGAHYRVQVDAIYRSVAPWPWSFRRVLDRLEILRHVPFDQPPENRWGERIPADRLTHVDDVTGALAIPEPAGASWVLKGTVEAPGYPRFERLLFLDDEDRVRGFAYPDGSDRWLGILRAERPTRHWAWARFEGRDDYVHVRRVRFDSPGSGPLPVDPPVEVPAQAPSGP